MIAFTFYKHQYSALAQHFLVLLLHTLSLHSQLQLETVWATFHAFHLLDLQPQSTLVQLGLWLLGEELEVLAFFLWEEDVIGKQWLGHPGIFQTSAGMSSGPDSLPFFILLIPVPASEVVINGNGLSMGYTLGSGGWGNSSWSSKNIIVLDFSDQIQTQECCKDQSKLWCDLSSAASHKELTDFQQWNHDWTWQCLLLKSKLFWFQWAVQSLGNVLSK